MTTAVRVEIPVLWGDMDAFAHVNNTVYLRWFESARIAWFERVGIVGRGGGGVGPILASTHCRFVRPLAFPDVIAAEATTTRIGRSSFDMAYRVVRRDTGELAAEGGGVIVMLDYATGKAQPIDDALRAHMLPFCQLTAAGEEPHATTR